MRALVFPGQGSQFIGMGKEFYDNFASAKEVFEEVNEALNQNLSDLIFSGDVADLTRTENTQPALMATSIAIMKTIEKEIGKNANDISIFVAGHSLGEYSALCAAKALNLSDCAKLLRIRGKAMQESAPIGIGAMAAILGMELSEIEALILEAKNIGKCQIANDNCPGQVVISGETAAVDLVIKLVQEKSKKAIKLPVSAPFHSILMEKAEEIMQNALASTSIKKPIVPIIANVIASDISDPEEIKKLLVKQICGRVRWRESMNYAFNHGVAEVVEIGAGKVLTGLNGRINKEIKAISIQRPDDMDNFIKSL